MDGLTFTSNVLTFIASIVGALAWPSVAIFLLFLLRPNIGSLAKHLRELTLPGGVKAVFAEQLEKARHQVEQIEEKAEPLASTKPIDFSDPYLELAQKYPEAGVLQSFKEVEAASRLYNEFFPNARARPVALVVQGLRKMELIDDETYALYRTVADIRNAAVHGPANSVTTGEAIEFRAICHKLTVLLKEAIRNIPVQKQAP